MNEFLKKKLQKLIGTDDFIHAEYKQLNELVFRDKVNFKKVRGSIRLISKRVKLPKDVAEKRKFVLSRKTI